MATVLMTLALTGIGCSAEAPCTDLAGLVPGDHALAAVDAVDLPVPVDSLLAPSRTTPGATELLAGHLPGPGFAGAPGPMSDAGPEPAPERAPPVGAALAVLPGQHVAPAPDPARAEPVRVHGAQAASPTLTGERVDASPTQEAAGLAVGLALIGLFHRLSRRRLLAHGSRQRILELLGEEAGLGTPEIAEGIGCSYRTARHHLDKLERHGLVVAHAVRGQYKWCLPEQATAVRRRLPAREERTLAMVADEPGLHLSAVAARLGVAKATAKVQLDRLVERGLVSEQRVGPLRCFYAADGAPGSR